MLDSSVIELFVRFCIFVSVHLFVNIVLFITDASLTNIIFNKNNMCFLCSFVFVNTVCETYVFYNMID